MGKYKVSVVVPAYNEGNKIGRILNALVASPYIDEIICVNDGSTDNTEFVIKLHKTVKLINLKKNRGKAFAVSKGIEAASGEIILFIDADVIGFRNICIKQLTEPLQNDEFDVAIGYHTFYPQERLTRPLSGERAYFKKDLMPHIKILSKKGYGMELYLNYLFKGKKIKIFPLRGVKHPLKPHKHRIDFAIKLMLTAQKDYMKEILGQKDPVSYFINSYFYPFYLTKPPVITTRIRKVLDTVKKTLD